MFGMSSWARYWARFDADRPALLFEGRDLTWGQLDHSCAQLAAGFAHEGLERGDRVGCLIRNAPEHFEVLLACTRLGLIFVPLNPMLTAPELQALASDAELSALVTDPTFVGVLDPLEQLVGSERIFFNGEPPAGGRGLDELRQYGTVTTDLSLSSNDPAMICYTSGTTGKSRGAVLTHGNMTAVAASAINVDKLTHDDRAIVAAPLAFTGAGVSFAVPMLYCGGSILIRQQLVPSQVLDDIEHNGVTFIGVVPLILERLAAEPDFQQRDLSSLRVVKSGGSPVPEHLIRLYQSRGVSMVNAYGLTEGSGLNLELQGHEALSRRGSVGIPLMGQDAKVVDIDGNIAPPGEPGELLLTGDCIMKEYWRDPEATARTLHDGWLSTGDIATRDEQGYFHIVDRSKDMIISGGINIYPAEIEAVLSSHPEITEVAVVGTPDPQWGETPTAHVVTTNPSLTLDDLNEFASDKLARFKQPRNLTIHDRPLPRNMSGKLLKRTLRDQHVTKDTP